MARTPLKVQRPDMVLRHALHRLDAQIAQLTTKRRQTAAALDLLTGRRARAATPPGRRAAKKK